MHITVSPSRVGVMIIATDESSFRLPGCDTQVCLFARVLTCSILTPFRFVLNGLVNANRVLKKEVFDLNDWRVIGEYVCDKDGGRHQAFYAPNKDVSILGISIQKDERVQVEQSLKYSAAESQTLWKQAGLKEVARWKATKDEYRKCSPVSSITRLRSPTYTFQTCTCSPSVTSSSHSSHHNMQPQQCPHSRTTEVSGPLGILSPEA